MTRKIDFEKHRKAQQGDEINNIFNSLVVTSGQDIAVLPEDVFVKNFLPLFAGEEVPENVSLNVWFGIAGNPYLPVKIVDSAKPSEVLYTVPAYFDRGTIDINNVDETASPLTHVLKTTEQLSRIHPKRAENYFQEQLNRRNISKEDSGLMSKNALAWIAIIERYGKPLPDSLKAFKTSVKSDSPTNETSASQESTGLVYDDDDIL